MKLLKSLVILTTLWLSSSLAAGVDGPPNETASRISRAIMCTCGCPHILDQCGDECGMAPQLEYEISEFLKSGKTEQEIYKTFEARFGPAIYAEPKAEGFNLLAWILPFVALVIGAGIVFAVVKNLKVEAPEDTSATNSQIDEKYRKLLDEELNR